MSSDCADYDPYDPFDDDRQPSVGDGDQWRFGLDRYGRYVVEDGERLVVEPHPFWGPLHAIPQQLVAHIVARYWIVRWHIGICRQHGLREWDRLRRL